MWTRNTVGAGFSRRAPAEAGAYLAFVMLFFLAGCGRVGDPQPPFIRIPEAVNDLAVTQSGNELILTWTNPRRYIDGSAATDLSKVRVSGSGGITTVFETTGPGQAQSYTVPVAGGFGLERTFAVSLETSRGRTSEVSNSVFIEPVEVPGQVQLSATVDQRRTLLSWKQPQDHPELADAYIVLRTDAPAEAATVSETRFDDLRYQAGKEFTYHVTAARRIGERLIPGVGPAIITVTAIDKTPPAVPHGIDLTPSESGAFLTWEPNEETDIAGYRVFRSDRPDGGFVALTPKPILANSYFDPEYRPGFHYGVSAIDESENESAMAKW